MVALGRMCFQPVDLLSGEHIDLLHDDTFASLRRLCASGLVGAAAAAPPCSAFSRSRLRPGGPPPIRTISHPRGKDCLSPPQATELATSSLIHIRCRELLALVAARGGLIWLENPTSSVLWLDSQVMAWCRTRTPFASAVAACAHSVPAHKSWTFMCNHESISSVASTCAHPLGFHPALSGKRSSDGIFLTRQTAQYPGSLASLLASVASPFVDEGQAGHSVRGWTSLLPTAACWPPPSGRVEDGAGLCSSATPFPPTQSDVLGGLRKAWCKRLLDSGLHQQIASRLLSGSKTNPLSEAELAPFLADLRDFLHVESDSTWQSLLSVLDGQPFRLNLWHCLCSDPDSDYFHVLREGVPLGIGSAIPVCPVMHPPAAPDAVRLPLEHCESAWKSALDNADVVESLLQGEVDAGWIREVPGGDAELRRLYQYTAVGKLGLVLAPGRPPRLVVDSSVSGVTSNTHLPNRSANPSLMGVRRSVPISDSLDQLVALVLDVAKAHRRMLIRPADRGLLCFRHAGRLYQCITLNFGARVSSFFWARCAGLLMRLLKRLLRVRHSSWIYVDDILALFNRLSAPLWASVVVVLLLCLKIPMSWHKGTLSPSVVWIGWQMDFECFTVRLDPSKLSRLIALANQVLNSRSCPVRDLERLTGKLLWLSSLFRCFRPSLAPLYADQHSYTPVLTAVSPEKWQALCDNVDSHLVLLRSVGIAAIPVGSKLLRVGQTTLTCRRDLCRVTPEQRRLWVQSSCPSRSVCQLSDSSCQVIRMWLDLAASGSDVRSLILPPRLECTAFADACADASSVGMGGFVRLHDGRQLFFQTQLAKPQMLRLFQWLPSDCSLQSYIATWELASQAALLFLLHRLLGDGHLPCHTVFRSDNSAAESASWKGLSMALGLCSVLRVFFALQESLRISVHVDHVPGISNDIADGLSRGHEPASFGFSPSESVDIDWSLLAVVPCMRFFPSDESFSGFVSP